MTWDLMQIIPAILAAYTNIIPASIFWGLILSSIVLGMWVRNNSVRLVSITFIMLSPLLMTAGSGISWGVPLALQSVGQGLAAAGLAGLALSFIKK